MVLNGEYENKHDPYALIEKAVSLQWESGQELPTFLDEKGRNK